MNPTVARALAERACKPAARAGAKDVVQQTKKVAKRAKSAYSRKYKTAFNNIAPKYNSNNDHSKKGGFRRAVKEAHRMVKK